MLAPLLDYWRHTNTRFEPLSMRETWKFQQQWREAFGVRFHTAMQRWPTMEALDELEMVFASEYQPNCWRRSDAQEAYATQATMGAQQYLLFTLLKNQPGFRCVGRLPPTDVILRATYQDTRLDVAHPVFLLCDAEYTWTAYFRFWGNGPYFARRETMINGEGRSGA